MGGGGGGDGDILEMGCGVNVIKIWVIEIGGGWGVMPSR